MLLALSPHLPLAGSRPMDLSRGSTSEERRVAARVPSVPLGLLPPPTAPQKEKGTRLRRLPR
jgi:hypothetical protein